MIPRISRAFWIVELNRKQIYPSLRFSGRTLDKWFIRCCAYSLHVLTCLFETLRCHNSLAKVRKIRTFLWLLVPFGSRLGFRLQWGNSTRSSSSVHYGYSQMFATQQIQIPNMGTCFEGLRKPLFRFSMQLKADNPFLITYDHASYIQ